MNRAKHLPIAFAALLGAAALALPAAAQPEVTPLSVTSAPTTIHVSIQGKSPGTVYKDVRQAAYTVCSNAVGNHEISLTDHTWCSDTASAKAMRTFAQARSSQSFADSGFIVVAAR